MEIEQQVRLAEACREAIFGLGLGDCATRVATSSPCSFGLESQLVREGNRSRRSSQRRSSVPFAHGVHAMHVGCRWSMLRRLKDRGRFSCLWASIPRFWM